MGTGPLRGCDGRLYRLSLYHVPILRRGLWHFAMLFYFSYLPVDSV